MCHCVVTEHVVSRCPNHACIIYDWLKHMLNYTYHLLDVSHDSKNSAIRYFVVIILQFSS